MTQVVESPPYPRMKTSRILPDFANSLPAITCCLVASVLLSPSCTKKADPSRWDARETLDLTKTIEPMVAAWLETDAVAAAREEDSADDPAIWLSSKTPSLGVVMGTNKKAGIHVYDLSGKGTSVSRCWVGEQHGCAV